jgi:type IV pilus assembly protein PilM
MPAWIKHNRCGPIGIDLGTRSVKLVQFDAARERIHEAARWDLPAEAPGDSPAPPPAKRAAEPAAKPLADALGPNAAEKPTAPPTRPAGPASRPDQFAIERLAEGLERAREGRTFRGRDAVFCLGAGDLYAQNIRVAQASGDELKKIVQCEAAGRLPFKSEEAEIRFLEAGDVRQGDSTRREVILLASHRPAVERILAVAEAAGLNPVAIDTAPTAMLRCYSHQYRRDDDQHRRVMFVNLGATKTTVVIAEGSSAMFVKYIDVGGRRLDEAVARHLKMPLADAAALRRHNGDRRAEQRDPEVARSIVESIRPVLDHLASELSLCLRYYAVTFRGRPLSQAVLSGGEASQSLVDWLGPRMNLPCELGDPMRRFETSLPAERLGQWDVALGLALRQHEN